MLIFEARAVPRYHAAPPVFSPTAGVSTWAELTSTSFSTPGMALSDLVCVYKRLSYAALYANLISGRLNRRKGRESKHMRRTVRPTTSLQVLS